MRTWNYTLETEKRTMACRDRQAAEYLYGCRKHATIIKTNRFTGEKIIVAEK